MNHNEENEISDGIKKEFGELSARQLWLLTRFAKLVRYRARNNAAYNNLATRIFPHAKFNTITKTKKDGTKYPGLEIVVDSDRHSEDDSPEN